ncbi:hypothetical protein EMIHUDRAFT_253417 [Emiliania huxleyi CCMP1516]|uniref:Chlorophyllase n=2 Tax=Emiliania huxleyi TaxID=2903 RepID=A0A0D3K814_EMIH1|nr:hypothetical protein EMIHUDRAFT_253417 [Emiliania huxleyi CCMP1516]EOD31899.1 hypothetical protein EMIHUDRAFT_253417 [Emiliania huxleyi CCMP1516]|eukprot:XP_005784328.1 hypothetical protein EMIHUDRAFT_253417 [Emiliania huxleyi CCMP1516]
MLARRSLLATLLAAAAAAATEWPDCSPRADGHPPFNSSRPGPFGSPVRLNATWMHRPIVVLHPTARRAFPLLVFMHGATAKIEMYLPVLELYSSHGFVVAFPYIESPSGDTRPLTLNTNGEYILRALDYASAAASNASSPLHGRVDMGSVVLAGHSMGGTCAVMAGVRVPAAHEEHDLRTVSSRSPLLLTTATNDGAFWPAPLTAQHERGCFKGALGGGATGSQHPAFFVQFSTAACAEDGARRPFADAGHDCAFKAGVETPWVLSAMKLYAQQRGRASSRCASMLLGGGAGSLKADPLVELSLVAGERELGGGVRGKESES